MKKRNEPKIDLQTRALNTANKGTQIVMTNIPSNKTRLARETTSYKRQARYLGGHTQTFKMSQKAFIQRGLNKIIRLGYNDEFIKPFTSNIDLVELPRGFVKPEMPNYAKSIDLKVFLSTFKCTLVNRVSKLAHMCKLFP